LAIDEPASWLLEIVRCPITLEPLQPAPQELIDALRASQLAGTLFNRLGMLVTAEILSGFVNASESWFYTSAANIPSLLPDEAIPVGDRL
jgi:uncharacterized protein YbaR (Trm112 family)